MRINCGGNVMLKFEWFWLGSMSVTFDLPFGVIIGDIMQWEVRVVREFDNFSSLKFIFLAC